MKILEAMALGTPVVATSKGAEGLDARSGDHLLVADSPHEFAESVIKLLKDGGESQKLISNAQQLVRRNYDWAIVFAVYLEMVEKIS